MTTSSGFNKSGSETPIQVRTYLWIQAHRLGEQVPVPIWFHPDPDSGNPDPKHC